MRTDSRLCGVFVIVLVAVCVGAGNEQAGDAGRVAVNRDVSGVRAGWMGRATNIEKVYERARPLLEKYAKDEAALARIYLVILESHALSDTRRHDEAVVYAKKAEKLPLAPHDKALLYRCWGDVAATRPHGGSVDVFTDLRREAAVLYLKATRVAVDQNLPMVLEKPKVPEGIDLSRMEHVIINIPEELPEATKSELRKQKAAYEARQQARQAYWRRIERWKQDTSTLRHVRVAREHLATLYAMEPHAFDEIRRLSAEVLGHEKRVGDLLARIREVIEEDRAEREQRLRRLVPTLNDLLKRRKGQYDHKVVAALIVDTNDMRLVFSGEMSEGSFGQHVAEISNLAPGGEVRREYHITCWRHAGRGRDNVVEPERLVERLRAAISSRTGYDDVAVRFAEGRILLAGTVDDSMLLKDLFNLCARETTYSLSSEVPALEYRMAVLDPEANTIGDVDFQRADDRGSSEKSTRIE